MAVEMSVSTASALRPYLTLFDEFVRGQVDATVFVDRFLRPYLADPTPWDPKVFPVLDRVFADADAYVESNELRPKVIDAIDADELRESVAKALAELQAG